jgi:glycosyltransferase involved in cell wall biosynthesis
VAWHVRDFARGGAIGLAWRSLAVLATLIITNSHATADQPALRHVRRRIAAVPNGIDLSTFRLRASAPEGIAMVGMVAHLTPWKGHARFIRVVANLLRRHPNLYALIAGGEYYDTTGHGGFQMQLQRLITESGLSPVCRIEHVAPDAMPAWLSALSVLVHCPDDPEPFGRALAEAMAVGVPVVAATAGGGLEVVGDAALTVPPRDDAAIADAVSAVLTDRSLSADLSRRGRQRVEERYDERRYVAATVAALERLWSR